jgi:hypothetical protein
VAPNVLHRPIKNPMIVGSAGDWQIPHSNPSSKADAVKLLPGLAGTGMLVSLQNSGPESHPQGNDRRGGPLGTWLHHED